MVATIAQDASVISVIVPTRNEAENVLPLLARLHEALRPTAIEVIFVDDSTDGTPAAIRLAATAFPFPIQLIARPPERRNGLSGAVVEGMAAAEGTWLCVMDADLQHPPEMVAQLLEQAEHTQADLAVGSRKAGAFGPMGLSRRRSLTSQLLTILARMVFPRLLKNVSDPLTGLFLVRRTAVDLALLRPDGFKILLEILIRHPTLRVSELHFDFAARHGGQSKADLHEGLRFFRHLVRLRLTANVHFVRFLALVLSTIAANVGLLAGLVERAGWPVLPAALLAGEVAAVWYFYWAEMWVFHDSTKHIGRRRWIAFFLLSQLLVWGIYLPLVTLLQQALPYLAADLLALLAVGFGFYLISEQWIWSRGLTMRQPSQYYYDLHGLLRIISQVALPDLAFFQVEALAAESDLQIRVDRQGTPSRLPGGISYDEQLGRFGFGLTVLPGEFTEIIVSPLLESSPGFLYTNVVEPLVRWLLVRQGYTLVQAGAIARPPTQAILIHSPFEMAYGLGRLCAEQRFRFAGDDRVILGYDGSVLAYPKPVTWRQQGDGRFPRIRRWLYSQPVRRSGLWFSARDLPVATLNTYLQRFIPQAKRMMGQLVPGVEYAGPSRLTRVVVLSPGSGVAVELNLEAILPLLLQSGHGPQRGPLAFQPGPLLADALSQWGGRDWRQVEREIVRGALRGCTISHWRSTVEQWWELLPAIFAEHNWEMMDEPQELVNAPDPPMLLAKG